MFGVSYNKMTMRYSRRDALKTVKTMKTGISFASNFLFSCIHMAGKNAHVTFIVGCFKEPSANTLALLLSYLYLGK